MLFENKTNYIKKSGMYANQADILTSCLAVLLTDNVKIVKTLCYVGSCRHYTCFYLHL